MWWTKNYINRRDWMLDNMENLQLSSNQLLVLMMIDYYNTYNNTLSQQILENKTGLDSETMNAVVASLIQLELLKVEVKGAEVHFNIDNVFDTEFEKKELPQNMFEVFEVEFGRTLSQKELEKLNEWIQIYSEMEILEALRKAIIYQKTSLNYIEAILVNDRNEK